MRNIGSVYYKKGIEPGTLDAFWGHSTDGYGTGLATGRLNNKALSKPLSFSFSYLCIYLGCAWGYLSYS